MNGEPLAGGLATKSAELSMRVKLRLLARHADLQLLAQHIDLHVRPELGRSSAGTEKGSAMCDAAGAHETGCAGWRYLQGVDRRSGGSILRHAEGDRL